MDQPRPIAAVERRARLRRARTIARELGFVGRVEYRHFYSSAGGAQYGVGITEADDILVVYADAFRRDANPADFSLEAIIAHERGHQLLVRHSRFQRLLAGQPSPAAEEVLASLVGSLIAPATADGDALFLKALAETLERGVPPEAGLRLVRDLRSFLEQIL